MRGHRRGSGRRERAGARVQRPGCKSRGQPLAGERTLRRAYGYPRRHERAPSTRLRSPETTLCPNPCSSGAEYLDLQLRFHPLPVLLNLPGRKTDRHQDWWLWLVTRTARTPPCLLLRSSIMRVASKPSDVVAPAGASVGPRVSRQATAVWLQLLMAALCLVNAPGGSQAAAATPTPPPMEARVRALIPDLEAYLASGMTAFDVPGLAIGIVAGDTLVYAKGFGVRSKGGGVPVDTRTIFQIGSATKAFLATTLAIMVDRGKLRWDDRIVDLAPDFQLKDPWVTREFRAFDVIAQRSGLPPYANDGLGMFGIDEAGLIR